MQTKPKTDPQGGKLRMWGDNRVTRSFTAAELLDKKFPRRALLLPFLRQSEAALIYGKSGAGKSWFLLALAL